MQDDLMAFGERAARDLGKPSCCGPSPTRDTREMPGYRLCGYVASFTETPAGKVPVVKTRLDGSDHLGGLAVRCNLRRSRYAVAPGLYAVGSPSDTSPVLVTANYKLSFDAVRRALDGMDAWLLAADTQGVNVWCAAGKGTFSAGEVAGRVKASRLAEVVTHRRLILPQLSASGVTAREMKTRCGFAADFGPVRAWDLPRFIEAGGCAEPAMRRVTFSLKERLVLSPVELSLTFKPLVWMLPVLFLLSGIGPGVFSFSQALERGPVAWAALCTGILAGAVVTPALLPWIPGRAFSLKGCLAGLACGFPFWVYYRQDLEFGSLLALILWLVAVSSYLAMNFTGATPFTSPTGVEYEMKRAIPAQVAAMVLGFILWVAAPFTG
ncbi:mercury methylation corrinoid protein HgcA [Desulfoluna spongiiphila]|uniref:CO dehydrogenase/acetyl-CoA synthase delta subunit n=1 Tax=Desulfoluna spongiiphila TaxID=419481 RepID=A0A1G5HHN2_9BACT|nr:mercury methylation corrinoid protein HgcA [Desulfoluna spongiiphila]SCY63375.1 CO dehydrogenase/acetyl-CoA synthase delta subunit [Desulfoluna spongiiphila]